MRARFIDPKHYLAYSVKLRKRIRKWRTSLLIWLASLSYYPFSNVISAECEAFLSLCYY